MKGRRLKAGHFFLDAETGMGAGEVPLVLFMLHVHFQLIHSVCICLILAQGTQVPQHKLSHRQRFYYNICYLTRALQELSTLW